MFAGGISTADTSVSPIHTVEDLQSAPQIPREQELIGVNAPIETIIASMNTSKSNATIANKTSISNTTKTCEKKRFSDVNTSTRL